VANAAQTTAADRANRNWTAFLLCIGLSLAWPSAPAFAIAQGNPNLSLSLWRLHLDSRAVEETSTGKYSIVSTTERLRLESASSKRCGVGAFDLDSRQTALSLQRRAAHIRLGRPCSGSEPRGLAPRAASLGMSSFRASLNGWSGA